MTMLLYTVGALTLIAVVWLVGGVKRIGAISSGKPIGDRSGTALILIDLQHVFWEHGPYSEEIKSEAEAVILDEVATARERAISVIAVRQEWSIPSTKMVARLAMKGQAVQGTPGVELAKPFAELADHVLVKRVQDAFETGELDTLLFELGVGRIRLVGLDFNYCIQKTALAARKRGYEVTIVRRGTLSAAPTQQTENLLTVHGVVLQ